MKKRISFWGIVFIITALLGGLGIKMYYDGHGSKGKIRSYLLPIAESYNSLDLVKSSNKLAVVKGDKIVIEDVNSNKYEYVYSEENGKEILTNEYSSSNSVNGQIIAKNMIEAISKYNGSKELIFSEYDFNAFEKTTIENGAVITNGSTIKVKIDTKKNILASIREAGIPKANNSNDSNNLNSNGNIDSNIIGTWYYTNNGTKDTSSYWTFNSDGTGKYVVNNAPINITYRTEGSSLFIITAGIDLEKENSYTIDGNNLTINDGTGDTIYIKD